MIVFGLSRTRTELCHPAALVYMTAEPTLFHGRTSHFHTHWACFSHVFHSTKKVCETDGMLNGNRP